MPPDRPASEAAHSDRESGLRRALDGAIDYAIIVTDPAGSITDWTAGAEAVLGWRRDEALGRGHELIYTPEDRAGEVPAREMELALAQGRAADERWHLRADGSRFFGVGELMPIRDEAGAWQGFIKIVRDGTGTHRAREALRESEARYRELADNISQLVWTADASGWIYWYNQRWYDYTGASPEEMQGWGWRSVHHPDHVERVTHKLSHAFRTGTPWEDTFPLRGSDGGYRWFLSRALPIRNAAGEVVRWFGTNTDITELREAQAALAQRTQEIERLTLAAPAAIYIHDRRVGRSTYVNAGVTRILGYDPGDIYALPSNALMTFVHPDDLGQVQGMLTRLETAADGEVVEAEYRMRHAHGHYLWMSDRVTVLDRDARGAVARVLGVSIDVSRRSEAEAALAASEARFQAIVDSIDQMIWSSRPDGVDDFYNNRWFEFTGLERSATESATWKTLFHPDDQERSKERWYYSLATGEPFQNEYRLRHRSGEYRWVLGRAQPVRDERGRIVRWYGTCTDIHEFKLADEERRRLAAIVEQSRDFIGITDVEGTPVYVNEAGRALVGLEGRPDLTTSLLQFFTEDDRDTIVSQALPAAQAGNYWEGEVHFRRFDDGRAFPVLYNIFPVRDASGGTIAYATVTRDLTEKKRVEAELRELNQRLEERVIERTAELAQAQDALRQSQKLEAMGQLTGGVAHDFNNLLTPIMASLDLLQRRGSNDERSTRLIEAALQSAERAKTLVQRLLAFARRQPLQPTAVDVGALVTGMSDLIASTCGPRIRLELDIEPALPRARADHNQLEMAVLNLAVNARDAMEDGGTLTIAASHEIASTSHRPRLDPGRYVRLCVADTGTGMDAVTRARAVEPFFSTKGVGKGTGLGLSMVHGLTAQLGGALEIDSAPGKGTTIGLWLPVAPTLPETEEDEPRPPALKVEGTALLVDDEELVRAGTATMLSELGYTVVEAASAEEALELVEHGLEPDVVLTDHLMPGMSGADLARRVRAERPGTPVLLLSGYTSADTHAPDLPRLAKPFRQAELAETLAALKAGH